MFVELLFINKIIKDHKSEKNFFKNIKIKIKDLGFILFLLFHYKTPIKYCRIKKN